MAQGSRQIQTQAQQQIQTLSPQQILVVKLLELPAIELEDRVRAELLENPALEEGKDDTSGDEYSNTPDADSNAEDGGDTDYDSLSDYLNEDDIPDYKLQENNHSKGEQAEEIPFSDTTSFYETLKEQLGERNLTEHQRELAEYLIGSLDDDGLLRKSLDSISDELAIYAGIEATTGELEEALRIIQDFDPAGLGARNLQECLLIQIRRKIEQQHFTPNPILYIEEAIISECYEDFTRKHWDKIQQKLGLEGVQKLFTELRGLAVKLGHAGIHFHITGFSSSNMKAAGYNTVGSYNPLDWIAGRFQPNEIEYPDYGVASADVAYKLWPEHHRDFDIPYVPSIGAGWDSTPRYVMPSGGPSKGNRKAWPGCTIFVNESPAAFKAFVQASFAYLNRHPDVPRFVTIACFNEWSEGHYLLPDNRFGYGMLNALGEAVGLQKLNQRRGK